MDTIDNYVSLFKEIQQNPILTQAINQSAKINPMHLRRHGSSPISKFLCGKFRSEVSLDDERIVLLSPLKNQRLPEMMS